MPAGAKNGAIRPRRDGDHAARIAPGRPDHRDRLGAWKDESEERREGKQKQDEGEPQVSSPAGDDAQSLRVSAKRLLNGLE